MSSAQTENFQTQSDFLSETQAVNVLSQHFSQRGSWTDKMGTEAAAVLKQTLKDLYLKSLPAEIFLFKCKAAEKQSKAQDTANQNCSTKPYSCYKTP